jgi:hypothetical protein
LVVPVSVAGDVTHGGGLPGLALPVYLPVAACWLTGPAGWLLAPFPTYWIVRSWPETDAPTCSPTWPASPPG